MVKLAPQNSDGPSVSLNNVAWAALEKIAKKQTDANGLADGSQHSVKLEITGNVDGQPFDQSISSVLSVGHRQTKSSSVNPQVPELISWILSKLNRATRNRILVDIPEEFVANEHQIPKSNEVLVSEVEHMLKRLRRTKTVNARGSVRCEFTL